ncbi:MAG: ATP-binding protein [Magnetococcus sp. DMHC-6]
MIQNGLSYRDQINFYTKQAMEANIAELAVVAKDPLFEYYAQEVKKGYQAYAQTTLKDIQHFFNQIIENSKLYHRFPDHMILFSPDWHILTIATANPDHAAKSQHFHEQKNSETFYTHYQDFSKPFSELVNVTHNTAIPLGEDLNGDGLLTQPEIYAFLHSSYQLPLEAFQKQSMEHMIEEIFLTTGQLILLTLLLFWVGRSVPKPFQTLNNKIKAIAEGHFDQDFATGLKISELIALGQALDQMKEAIGQREQALKHYTDNLEEMVQKRTKQLLHAERLASLGTFAAGMAHEINNPNSFILGNISFLKQYFSLANPILKRHASEDNSGRVGRFLDAIPKTLDEITDGSQRITHIVDSLKRYSKGGMETDKVDCRLFDPIQDAANLLIHEFKAGIALNMEVPLDILIHVDRQQFSQVFVNLFRNAIEAMQANNSNPEKKIDVTAKKIDNHVWIWVKDNGLGIPEEVAGKIFDPFYSTKGKTKGSGLGLSIVEGIIHDHRGQITVYSPPGQGAEFLIILPGIH